MAIVEKECLVGNWSIVFSVSLDCLVPLILALLKTCGEFLNNLLNATSDPRELWQSSEKLFRKSGTD
jgi:hypothetical protein